MGRLLSPFIQSVRVILRLLTITIIALCRAHPPLTKLYRGAAPAGPKRLEIHMASNLLDRLDVTFICKAFSSFNLAYRTNNTHLEHKCGYHYFLENVGVCSLEGAVSK